VWYTDVGTDRRILRSWLFAAVVMEKKLMQ